MKVVITNGRAVLETFDMEQPVISRDEVRRILGLSKIFYIKGNDYERNYNRQ